MRISDWSSDVCSSDLRAGPPERTRVVRGQARIAPDLIEPGHCQHAIVAWTDEERLLLGLSVLAGLLGRVPLEVPVGRQQAATRSEGPPIGRLLGDRPHPRVYNPVPDRGPLGPGGDKAPVSATQPPLLR